MLDSRAAVIHGRDQFADVLRADLAAGGRRFGNALVVVRGVDTSEFTDEGLSVEFCEAVALLVRHLEPGRPIGQLTDDVFAVALVGNDAPDAGAIADRLNRAVVELHRLSPQLRDLAVAISIVEISGYEMHDVDTVLVRSVQVVEAEQLWVERARSATLHLVDAAATLHLDDD